MHYETSWNTCPVCSDGGTPEVAGGEALAKTMVIEKLQEEAEDDGDT